MPDADESIELTMYIDYIQIDKQEQSLFNTNEIDYLFDYTERPIIQKLQNNTEHILLHFTKPVKELIIVFVNDSEDNNDSDLYEFLKIDNLEIKLNNIKLETSNDNDESYFRLLQPYFHNRNIKANANIYMYSFAFDPDSAQPTGSYNFGNLKSKELTIHGSNLNSEKPYVYIYANTNNVLKVSEGQAQVQFL